MNKTKKTTVVILAALSLLFLFPDVRTGAAPADPAAGAVQRGTLNPEGVNPHAEAPRKRISQEKKKAAAEARKQQKAEKAARKSGQPGQFNMTEQGAAPSAASNDGGNR